MSSNHIEELLRYVAQYRRSKMVFHLDSSIAGDADARRQLLRDLFLLDGIGVVPIVICPKEQRNLLEQDLLSRKETLPETVSEETQSEDQTSRVHTELSVQFAARKSGLSGEELAAQVAVQVGAVKLVFVTPCSGICDDQHELIRQISTGAARQLLEQRRSGKSSKTVIGGAMRQKLIHGINACEAGVARVHFINGRRESVVVEELFLGTGVGTMVCANIGSYAHTRPATTGDAQSVASLLHDNRLDAEVTHNIGRFVVLTLDHEIYGCVRLGHDQDSSVTVVDCLAIAESFDTGISFDLMMQAIREHATANGATMIRINEDNQGWFLVDPRLGGLGFKHSFAKGGLIWELVL